MNTPEGRKQGVETMRDKHGADIYAKIGSKGGKKMHEGPNAHQPMRDPAYASRTAKIRWLKYRLNKGQITEEEYNIKLAELKNVSTT